MKLEPVFECNVGTNPTQLSRQTIYYGALPGMKIYLAENFIDEPTS